MLYGPCLYKDGCDLHQDVSRLVATPHTAGAHIHSTHPYPSCSVSVSLLYLLHIVLRRSSPDEGTVDLHLVCCGVHALPALTIHEYLPYSTPAGRHCLTRSSGRHPYPTLDMFPACPCSLACPFCTCVIYISVHLVGCSVICCEGVVEGSA